MHNSPRSGASLGCSVRQRRVVLLGIAWSLIWFPGTARPASFDLDGDGKQETHLVSECGSWVAFKQTITHRVTNGLPATIVVTWPAAGLVDYPVRKGAAPKVQSWETYKSCIPAEDKGVEFKIASKDVRKFERGAPAAMPGYVTRWFVDTIKEMGVAELGRAVKELALVARTLLGDRPLVSVTSRVAAPPRPGGNFQYRYTVENHTPEPFDFFIATPERSFKGFVEGGKRWEETLDSARPPADEMARATFKTKEPDDSMRDSPLSMLVPGK